MEVLIYILLADYFGRESYGAIAGTLRPFEASGLGVGQIVGPVIYDSTGSYTLMILISSGLLCLSAVLMLLTRRPSRPDPAPGPVPPEEATARRL